MAAGREQEAAQGRKTITKDRYLIHINALAHMGAESLGFL